MKACMSFCVGFLACFMASGKPDGANPTQPLSNTSNGAKQTFHVLDIDLRRVNKQLVFDDPVTLFSKIFPDGSRVARDKFETTAEFRSRVDQLGASIVGNDS
jgi:hypothetical protein